jgi:hypothetical protein
VQIIITPTKKDIVMRILILILCLVALAGCVGPFVQEFTVEPYLAERLREDVVTVTRADLRMREHDALGLVTATSCFNNLFTDEGSSNQAAMDQLRYKASSLGANAILNPMCEKKGTSFSKNCWTSFDCTGTAIYIPEFQVIKMQGSPM